MKPLLLIDLDHTLFDTDVFWQDFMQALTNVTGIRADIYDELYEANLVGEGRLRHINYENLLTSVGANDEILQAELTKIASKKQYLYPEAAVFLKEVKQIAAEKLDVELLTFGKPEFQNIKLRFVPELANLQANITQVLKTDFISQQFSSRTGFLIDDKPGQELPAGWTEIHFDRRAPKYAPPVHESSQIIRITALHDALSVIDENL